MNQAPPGCVCHPFLPLPLSDTRPVSLPHVVMEAIPAQRRFNEEGCRFTAVDIMSVIEAPVKEEKERVFCCEGCAFECRMRDDAV